MINKMFFRVFRWVQTIFPDKTVFKKKYTSHTPILRKVFVDSNVYDFKINIPYPNEGKIGRKRGK
jgi:hypothetical protein